MDKTFQSESINYNNQQKWIQKSEINPFKNLETVNELLRIKNDL